MSAGSSGSRSSARNKLPGSVSAACDHASVVGTAGVDAHSSGRVGAVASNSNVNSELGTHSLGASPNTTEPNAAENRGSSGNPTVEDGNKPPSRAPSNPARVPPPHGRWSNAWTSARRASTHGATSTARCSRSAGRINPIRRTSSNASATGPGPRRSANHATAGSSGAKARAHANACACSASAPARSAASAVTNHAVALGRTTASAYARSHTATGSDSNGRANARTQDANTPPPVSGPPTACSTNNARHTQTGASSGSAADASSDNAANRHAGWKGAKAKACGSACARCTR